MAIITDSFLVGAQVIQGGTTQDITEIRTIQGGVTTTVWNKITATPYVATLNSVTWTHSTTNEYSHDREYYATSSKVYLYICKGEDLTEYGHAKYSATFNTQGCNKVRIKAEVYNPIDASCTINGTEITSNTYYYFDCSGSTYTIAMDINTGGQSWEGASLAITEVYFYYE